MIRREKSPTDVQVALDKEISISAALKSHRRVIQKAEEAKIIQFLYKKICLKFVILSENTLIQNTKYLRMRD